MNNEQISYEDLKTINDNMIYLSNRLNSINDQSDNFQDQIDSVQSDVDALKKEITDFINEVKQSNRISNAKQTIMLSQMEYDKKYSSRDEVRRRITGILQAADSSIVRKNTMESIAEETIVNNPDYWLAPALVALCYWYTDNKELANKALKKALDRSDEKTSLLFCLVHLRAGRINTSKKWLKRYLSLQDPTNMDCKIILLLDALSSGVFAKELKEEILDYINFWNKQLKSLDIYKYSQINSWKKYFNSIKDKIEIDDLPYVEEFVVEKEKIHDKLYFSKLDEDALSNIKKIINDENYTENNFQDKIDRIVHTLIFDYEDEELTLKNEIKNNKNIIDNNGKISTSEVSSYIFNGVKVDFYSILTNICLGSGSEELSSNTKKLALSLSKEFIISGYNEVLKNNKTNSLPTLTIKIDEWTGSTTNGDNELSLMSSLHESINEKYQFQIPSLITKELYISWIVGVVALIVALIIQIPILLIPIILAELLYAGYIIIQNKKKIDSLKNNIFIERQEKIKILTNVMSDITDYYFKTLNNKNNYENVISYINRLNSDDFIKIHFNNTGRNINIREK